jgi:HEXXH motif-containing protein
VFERPSRKAPRVLRQRPALARGEPAKSVSSEIVEAPNDLAVPNPGSSTVRRIVGAYLKRTTKDLLALPLSRFDSHVADDFADLRSILERELRAGNAGPVLSILRRPTHSTLVRCIDAELWGNGDVKKLDAWLTELTGLLAFELAGMGLLPEQGLLLRRAPPRFVSIALGVELVVAPDYRIGFRPGVLVLERGDMKRHVELDVLAELDTSTLPGVTIRSACFPLEGGPVLALADNNPLSSVEAHPNKEGNTLDLGGLTEADWARDLIAALRLVAEHLPDLAEEMRLVMQLLVPVGYDGERHLSASYAESVGTAYLSLHPDPMTMAEALIHEFSHNKLNALLRLDKVLENAHSPLFSSPVRPDPRPLHGVLLAVHAFVPVARLYERMLANGHPLSSAPQFRQRMAKIIGQNHEGTETLRAHAVPTKIGRGVLDELVRWDAYYSSFGTATSSNV